MSIWHFIFLKTPKDMYLYFDCWRYALSIAEEVKKANEDTKEYLSNPIDDYILIKRLTVDWNVTKNLIVGDFDQGNSVLLKFFLLEP